LKVKKEVAMAITEKHTKGTPVSNMTLADLNRRNQQTYTADAPYAEELRRGMDPKEDQLRPGTTVHNSRGLTGKVVRVEGNRVVVRCPDGSQDQWDLRRTHEYAGDGLIPLPLTREGREQYRRGLEEKIVQLRKGVVRGQQPEDLSNAEEQLKRLKATGDESTDSEGTEALREGVEEFLAEEEAEPEHQTDEEPGQAPGKVEKPDNLTSTSNYQRMRAELYTSQHPGTTMEQALKIVNSR
jgi:hypothetical protein